MSDTDIPRPGGEIVLYQTPEGGGQIRVLLEGETVWLPQAMIAELFQTSIPNINIHFKNIYEEGELDEAATVKEYLIVRQEGSRQVSRKVLHYSLDAILAVGYRVKSPVATAFRQWATARLREYLVKGFTLNDDRLKGVDGITDYFDELLARIREIRASEARVYQRIREIFALAVDYREGEQETQRFFATMQNKMHFAATGHTAAEIIRRRADSALPNMGLTTWKGGRVLKRDVGTAKNYLDAKEIDTLNRITVMFLDQAEFRAQRRQDIHTHEWLVTTPSALITEAALQGSSAKWVPVGALLMALAGQGKTKGMVAQTGFETTCNQSMAAILPSKAVESRFLLWWLHSQYGKIRGLAGDEQRNGADRCTHREEDAADRTPPGSAPKFIYYLFDSVPLQGVIKLLNTGSTIPTMTQEAIGALVVPMPERSSTMPLWG